MIKNNPLHRKHRRLFAAIVILMVITGITGFKLGKYRSYPTFEEYTVSALEILHIGNIPPALVTFDDTATERTCYPHLLPDTMYDPNFCGHYFLQTLPCGTMCEGIALLDCKTGKVTLPDDLGASLHIDCRINSRLMVINPPVNVLSLYKDLKETLICQETRYYEFRGGKFKLIAKRKYGRWW